MAEPAQHLWVNGVVAVRDNMPYVQLSNEHGMIAQLTMGQARQVAHDLLVMTSRTEMDAMVLKFFSSEGFPEGAGAQLMTMLRDFRAELDNEDVQHKIDRSEG